MESMEDSSPSPAQEGSAEDEIGAAHIRAPSMVDKETQEHHGNEEEKEQAVTMTGSNLNKESKQEEKEMTIVETDPVVENSGPDHDEGWVSDKHLRIRRPAWRVCSFLFIILLDFYIYAEDPIQDSNSEAALPVVGNVVTFVGFKYPDSGGFSFLKVLMVLMFGTLGLYVGRVYVHHKLLRDRWRVNMFEEDKGTFTIMGITMFFFLYFGSVLYNVFLPNDKYEQINAALGFSNADFGRFAQSCTWLGKHQTLA